MKPRPTPVIKVNLFALIKLYRIVKRLIRQWRKENMCIKKIISWFSPAPDSFDGEKRLLSFAISDYPGTENDLRGCINDQNNLAKRLVDNFGFEARKIKDSSVTRLRFQNELISAINTLQPGDLVLMFMDCCFAEDNTRNTRLQLRKRRFVRLPETPLAFKKSKKKILRNADIKWIAFSASQDYQSADDAYIDGEFQGAFTYYALKSLTKGITYRQWYEKTKELMARSSHTQIPEIQGRDDLLDKIVLEGRVLVVQYSGHGTTVKDRDGDEDDQQDEALYLYDGIFLDDDLNKILQNIPSINQKQKR